MAQIKVNHKGEEMFTFTSLADTRNDITDLRTLVEYILEEVKEGDSFLMNWLDHSTTTRERIYKRKAKKDALAMKVVDGKIVSINTVNTEDIKLDEDYLNTLTKKELIGIIKVMKSNYHNLEKEYRDRDDFYDKKCRIMQNTINRLRSDK